MLVELKIANFAIIDKQSVVFGPGLNVLSGETGAGKSIILGALELILGAKPKPHAIRDGCEALEVEALFDLSEVDQRVIDDLPEFAQGSELSLVRTVSSNGRGKIYINGRIGTVSLLEEIVSRLVNICGQSHHVRLLNPNFHLEMLDSFSGNEDLLVEYNAHYTRYRELSELLKSAEHREKEIVSRRCELEEIIAELSSIELYAGVREELEERVARLANAEKLLGGIATLEQLLTDENGAASLVRSAFQQITELGRLDARLNPIAEQLSNAQVVIREVVRDLDNYSASLDINESQLEELRDHLAEVARLERKYRTNDLGLVSLLEKAKEEFSRLEFEVNTTQLIEKLEASRNTAIKLAEELSRRRKLAAEQLTKIVEMELAEVNMKNARLQVELVQNRELGSTGYDKAEFLLASNKGSALRPLRQIASGGELSRILLVCKKVLGDRSGVNVLVFDEVDTGISGGVARAVGLKLKALAKDSQVICITHLPQVASLADTHLLVTKIEEDETRSVVKKLSHEDRVDEIARMLSGSEITRSTRESAKELLTCVENGF